MFSEEDQGRLSELLRQASSLAASLIAAHSPADVRPAWRSRRGGLRGRWSLGGALLYDPLIPYLRIDESEGLAHAKAVGFQFEVSESFVRDVFEKAASGENPNKLEQALIGELGFASPVVYPLGAPSRLRGVWVTDVRAGGGASARTDRPLDKLLGHMCCASWRRSCRRGHLRRLRAAPPPSASACSIR